MISLHRFTRLQADAKYQRQVALTAKRVGRAGQIARSSVETGDGTASVGDLLADAPTVAETVEDHVADLETLDPGLDVFDDTQESEDAAHQADMAAIGANLVVTEALDAAEGAAELAVLAKETADGRNRVYAQMIKPVAHPDTPFVAGDLWYQTDATGRFIGVAVWNATDADFKPYQMVAGSLLVPGSIGPTLIGDNAITTPKLAATAIDGMTVTGALLRTAASGQRMQFDINGLRAFNASGVETANLSSAGGGMTLAGMMRFVNTATQLYSVIKPGDIQAWDNPSTIDQRNEFIAQPTEFFTRRQRLPGVGGMTQVAGTAGLDEAVLSVWHLANGPVGYRPSNKVDVIAGPAFTGIRFEDYGTTNTYGELEFVNGGFKFKSPVAFVGDTDGWVDITSSAMLSTFRGSLKYQIKNREVTLHVKTNSSGVLANGQTTVATLPSELFPHDLLAQAAYMSSNTIGMLLLNAAGAVVFMNTSGANRVTGTALISYPI